MGAEDGQPPKSPLPLDPTAAVGKGAAAPTAGPRWLRMLQADYGSNFIVLLVCVQHLTKGFVKWLTDSGEKFVLEEYGVSAAQMAIYQGVIRIPWAAKPVFGLISDYFPIMGYCRGPYIILTTFLAIGALCTLGFAQASLPVLGTVLLLMTLTFHISFSDLLTEAVYAKGIRANPTSGPDLIAFVWGGLFVMGSIGTAISGGIIESSGPWTLYLVALLPCAVTIVPASLNYLGERKLDAEAIAAQRANVAAQVECVFLCGVMLCATLTLTATGIFVHSKAAVAGISLAVGLVVLGAFSLLLSPVIAKVNAFGMIQTLLALRYGTAQFFYLIDDEDAYGDGPHFSKSFVATTLPLVGSAFGLIGIVLYKVYMTELRYTTIYIWGNCVAFFAFSLDTVFYLQWNRRLGISDSVFVLGSQALEEVIHSFLWMPSTVIMSHLCPKGLEAIMFALLASNHNLGAIISTNVGAFFLEVVGCNPTGKADFDSYGRPRNDSEALDRLWMVSLTATTLPMLSILLVPWFIPARKQNENLIDGGDGDVPATTGSLYRRWLGRDVPGETADPEERVPLRPHEA